MNAWSRGYIKSHKIYVIMKKLFILSLIFISCKKDVINTNSNVKDCNCDRVVERHKFNMVGNQPGQIVYFGDYITINDCTGVQKQGDWDSLHDPEPIVGNCY
jgi:phosphorylcholine metabolism protein LicD